MATLKAKNIELEFSYHDLTGCGEIEYALEIRWGDKPLFNPDIMSERYNKYGKFVFSDCDDDFDWLHKFFIDILKTRKGNSAGMMDSPEWTFNAITWEDRRAAKEKEWEGKTCAIGHADGTITHEPYAETMKMFILLWENDIELQISIPPDYFIHKDYSDFTFSAYTTFDGLLEFLNAFGDEMNEFYEFFGERIRYLGNGKYEERQDFKYHQSYSLDADIYQIKRCAEWNRQKPDADDVMILKLLLHDVRWRNCTVGTVRHIVQSSITDDLAREIFSLAEEKLKAEQDEEAVKAIEKVKTALAIGFPNVFSMAQLDDALKEMKEEDIPEEIYGKNEVAYFEQQKGV